MGSADDEDPRGGGGGDDSRRLLPAQPWDPLATPAAANGSGGGAAAAVAARQKATVIRKIDLHILPIFLAMTTLCYVDRTNTAFASLQMNRDLGFSPTTYGLGSGLFFLGYSLSMVPSQLALMRVGAPRWLAFIVTGWGLTAMSFSLMSTKGQFWALRVCLGVFESGAFPGMWHFLNTFYPPCSITVPYSLVEAAVGVANVVGAPLAAGLLLLDGRGGVAGWRWLFALEGLPSVCVGAAMARVLPRDFHTAPFLSAADKAWLSHAHAGRKAHAADAEAAGALRLLGEAARNGRVWLCGAAALLKNAAMVGLLFWCPIIIDSIVRGTRIDAEAAAAARLSSTPGGAGAGGPPEPHGLRRLAGGGGAAAPPGDVRAVLLTAVPFVCAAAAAVLLGGRSQRVGEKARHAAVPYFVAAALFGAFPYAAAAGGGAAFFCLTAAITSLTAPNAILNSLAASAGQGPASALALALYNAVGNLGGLLGPWLIGRVVEATGLYAAALQLLGLCVAVAGGIVWHMREWKY